MYRVNMLVFTTTFLWRCCEPTTFVHWINISKLDWTSWLFWVCFFAAEHQDSLIVIICPSLAQCSYVLQRTYLHSIVWSKRYCRWLPVLLHPVTDFSFWELTMSPQVLWINWTPGIESLTVLQVECTLSPRGSTVFDTFGSCPFLLVS